MWSILFYFCVVFIHLALYKLALAAKLDARPTGDQEVAGSTPTKVGNIFSWRLIMKYSLVILSLPLKGICQFLAKECAQY